MFNYKKLLYISIILGFFVILFIPSITYAHWYCYGTQASNYTTRPVATYSTSYNNATNKITLVIEGKICKQTPWSGIAATHWLFGTKTQVCTLNFPGGECGIGGYGSRKCCWHLNPVIGVWPSQYHLINPSFQVVVRGETDSRCSGNIIWVVTRTIEMPLSDYNSISGNGRGFVMGVNNGAYKSYPSEFITLASYSPPTPTLNVSCSSSPNPANTNQTVNFSSSSSGGTGSYIYSWSGSCTGSSQNCSNSFSNSGTYTATVSVTSGTQTGSANCSVNVSQPIPSLSISCSASPNPANTNQTVNFSSSSSGGTGSYTYSWSGSCAGSSQSCSNSFPNAGTYTATVSVTSGTQTGNANCSVSVNSQNINHSYKQCYNNDVYWYDSQGTRQEMYEDCGDDSWTSNYQCSGSTWLQRQKNIRWCSAGVCQQSLRYDNYQDCSASGQTCQNNQCGGQNQNRYLNCYDNDVYWYDYLGGRQEKYQDCGDSYCTDTGSNYCVGNSIYRQRTCYNRGCTGNACYSTTSYSDNQFVQTCGYGQTCQNGSCTSACECTSGVCCDGCHYKNTSSICNTETQNEYGCPWGSACGSDVGQRTKTRNQYCSGYSASCTGIWSSWTGLSSWTTVDYCSTEETCVYGNSVCQPKSGCGGSSYILHYAKKCYDSDLYWYDSLNVRQDKYRDCQDANECTIDNCFNNQCQNELRCDGATCAKGSIDYCNVCDYCGDGACNCGETISSCENDCQVIGLALTLFGKKESEAVQWLKSFSAGSIEKIDFLAVVSNGENRTMDNVVVKVDFPQEVLYKGELMLEGVPYNGDIRSGVTLGSLAPGTTKIITFKGEITSESSIFRPAADVVGTITTASGSDSDNVQINFLKEGQQIISESEGWLAGLLGVNLNRPIYILLIIIIVILVLVGLSRVIRGFKK
ncbi:hypothetical protein KKE19_02210 [Patescibacteria group bacterium]|nr:hypothetical protein [Patescibacteria group bacterium]MBU4461898.1 hypothetical protein [Patescibacteria group bacterium]